MPRKGWWLYAYDLLWYPIIHVFLIQVVTIYYFQTEMDFYYNLIWKESVHNFWSSGCRRQTRPPERPGMTNIKIANAHSNVIHLKILTKPREIPLDTYSFFSVVLALMQLQCSSAPLTIKRSVGGGMDVMNRFLPYQIIIEIHFCLEMVYSLSNYWYYRNLFITFEVDYPSSSETWGWSIYTILGMKSQISGYYFRPAAFFGKLWMTLY